MFIIKIQCPSVIIKRIPYHVQKKASYGTFFGKPIKCKDHREINMKHVIYKKECEHENCHNRALYKFKNDLHVKLCYKHRKKLMIPFGVIICKENNCTKTASFNFPGEKDGLY